MWLCLLITGLSLSVSLPIQASIEPQAAGDEFWDTRFGAPGVDGGGYESFRDPFTGFIQYYDTTTVNALIVEADAVWVGGRFTTAGGLPVRHIARWNRFNNTWSALGTGVNGTVGALAADSTSIYVGGVFSEAGGIAARNIARWDRATGRWFAIGAGLPADVRALAMVNGVLYAGGVFGGYLARWNGSSWEAADGGANGIIEALVAGPTGELYAGGFFTTIGGVAANRIARRDTNGWAALGSGLASRLEQVNTIAIQGDDLYIGGDFNDAGEVAGTRNVARWSISERRWNALNGGVSAEVESLAVSGNEVLVGGLFRQAGGLDIRILARWNKATGAWSRVGAGVDGSVNVLVANAGTFYAGGIFTNAGDQAANRVARVAAGSDTWLPLGAGSPTGGLNAIVYEVAVHENSVYVAGLFTERGSQKLYHVARYDIASQTWFNLGDGVDSQINTPRLSSFADAFAFAGNTVYVGGFFTSVGNQDPPLIARNVARWDRSTQTWAAMGEGMNGAVYDLLVGPDGTLYAGGDFATADNRSAPLIAAWNGQTWLPLGTGLAGDANASVIGLAMIGTTLYAGGSFTSAGGNTANGLARWNGATWAAVDASFRGYVSALAVQGTTLWVTGRFTASGLPNPSYVAAYNTQNGQWFVPGGGVNDFASSVAIVGTDVYVGGLFSQAGGLPAMGIARWDGQRWAALGSGVAGGHPANGFDVISIASAPDGVYLGGLFTGAGGQAAGYFTRYGPRVMGPVVARIFLPRIAR
jgi:trimeric autotransporter adhesin